MSPLGAFNFFVLQWTGLRVARCVQPGGKVKWRVLRWVWPLTGWWSEYRWIHRVWPLHQIGNGSTEKILVEAIAEEIALDIDRAIIDDLFHCDHCGESLNCGYHDDCKIAHYVIYRSIESDGNVGYTLMGADVAEQNVEVLHRYDPEGTHEMVMDLHLFTWGQAKEIQDKLYDL